MPDSVEHAFLGETLFYFFESSSEDATFEIFDSIVRRGLLMTIGNKEGKLDRFMLDVGGGNTESVEVMQQARVCFTDIPEDKLANHGNAYGRFGLGFSRSKIISWGGNPVIYMPNHAASGTLQDGMSSTLYGLHRAALLVEGFHSLLTGGFGNNDVPLTINGHTLSGHDRDAYVQHARHSIYRILSFVKEMSSQLTDDYHYLYEREWRIVAGVHIAGCDPCRVLTAEEKAELGRKRAHWSDALSADASIVAKYPHTSVLDFFRFLNGLAGETVSQAIEAILVPDKALRTRIEDYVTNHPDRFCRSRPAVRVFGERSGHAS